MLLERERELCYVVGHLIVMAIAEFYYRESGSFVTYYSQIVWDLTSILLSVMGFGLSNIIPILSSLFLKGEHYTKFWEKLEGQYWYMAYDFPPMDGKKELLTLFSVMGAVVITAELLAFVWKKKREREIDLLTSIKDTK